MPALWAQITTEIWWAIGIGVGVLAGVIVAITLYGCLLPREHRVRRTLALRQSVQSVWDTITDFANMPSWHRDVIRVERLPDHHGRPVWRETCKGNYPIQLETTEAVAPTRLVRTIADINGPFTGRWEFELSPQGEGCQIAITEIGEVPNPFFRFMARMFMNPAYYLERYLGELARRFNEPAEIRE